MGEINSTEIWFLTFAILEILLQNIVVIVAFIGTLMNREVEEIRVGLWYDYTVVLLWISSLKTLLQI